MRRFTSDDHRSALAALTTASVLFGLTVPLTKTALGWLDAAWLTAARFALAAPVLAFIARATLRRSASAPVAAYGALGYGAVIVLQNEGIARTSVLHATVILGAVPALVAVLAFAVGRGVAGRRTWTGLGIALVGMALVAGSGGQASLLGDGLMLASALLNAAFTVAQAELLRGRDPVAVTAIQMAVASVLATALAAPGGLPPAPQPSVELVALLALVVAGTLLPYSLFARGQARSSAETAGAFLNIEPLVGAAIGVLVFHDPVGALQAFGALAVVGGIILSITKARGSAARGSPLPA